MKKADVKVNGEYSLKINGVFVRVRITGGPRPDPVYLNGRQVFDWVRVNPPENARKLNGYASPAALHPLAGG